MQEGWTGWMTNLKPAAWKFFSYQVQSVTRPLHTEVAHCFPFLFFFIFIKLLNLFYTPTPVFSPSSPLTPPPPPFYPLYPPLRKGPGLP